LGHGDSASAIPEAEGEASEGELEGDAYRQIVEET